MPKRQQDRRKNQMNTATLANKIGSKAQAFLKNDDLLEAVVSECNDGDAIIYMSSGSFSGVQYRTLKELGKNY